MNGGKVVSAVGASFCPKVWSGCLVTAADRLREVEFLSVLAGKRRRLAAFVPFCRGKIDAKD
jgi:hypothetical protein